MEKRNFITSVRTPQDSAEDEFEKIAESIQKKDTDLTKKACEEDEKSDRENSGDR